MTPRMRTIKETIEELKAIDPDTAIREYFVRDLVNSGAIPCVRAGRKILINFDRFLEYLNGTRPPEASTGTIRPIEGAGYML